MQSEITLFFKLKKYSISLHIYFILKHIEYKLIHKVKNWEYFY